MAMGNLQFNSHQVEILYDSDPSPICAGTLISSYLVLTVFSCLTGKNETRLKVRSSSKNAVGISQIRNVETIHTFPGFKSDPSENDIAVLLLDSDFQLGKSLKVVDILQHNADEPDDFFSLSQSSSSSCGNARVERTEKSDCSPTSICVQPSQQSSCALPLPVPLIGSGLVCEVRGILFLCGALANIENGANVREYTDISKYLHWIELTFDVSSEKDAEDLPRVYGLGPKVFNGREVSSSGSSSSIPYQLSLQQKRHGMWLHVGGAVLIDEKTALTMARFFDDKRSRTSDYRVVAGITHLDSISISNSTTKQILPLKRIIRHPLYETNKILMGNDIAIIHVNGSFVYTENVQNIWISSPNGTNFTDFRGRVSGWGKTSTNGGTVNSLQEAEMRILSDSECKKIWTFLKPSMICAYDNISNTCAGDSGGPLVIKNYQFNQKTTRDLLVGISAFGPVDCEQPDTPSGFAEVSHFLDWIKENRGLKCEATEFQCSNGQCIDECSLCNGADECGDGSDEEQKNCPLDLEKKASCAQKKQEKCEKSEEELKSVMKSQTQKIQELEKLVKTLNGTVTKILKHQNITLSQIQTPTRRPNAFYKPEDFNLTAKMRIPYPEDPTEVELAVCVNSFQSNGARDSIASIQLPSGYIFYSEDFEAGSEFMAQKPRNVQRFELMGGNTKMDVYFSEIPKNPPTCLSLPATQIHEVANAKNPVIRVYEYLDPSRTAQVTYIPAHKVTVCQFCQRTRTCTRDDCD